jgi:hypothetical protein
MCKKCIHEGFKDSNKQGSKKSLNRDQLKMLAQTLGMKTQDVNAYQNEKTLIKKVLDRMEQFNSYYTNFVKTEISTREEQSTKNCETVPKLMEEIFAHIVELLKKSEDEFTQDIKAVVEMQKEKVGKDTTQELPKMKDHLSETYKKLAVEMKNAGKDNAEGQIEVIKKYTQVFKHLDSEFEKHFNKYDSVSKLHRLLEQEGDTVMSDFLQMIESNLRVDFNTKESFRNSYGQQCTSRLHSFQWNQKYIQVYRVQKNDFYKKYVNMTVEVPLYSRSIATEDGCIYLIGGYIKQQNAYLKSCLKYDEVFEEMEQKSQMIHMHADHSLATLNGFIYVVGSFVNNQVIGDCERYDVSQDKWSLIASLNIPRSGVALC